MQGEFLRKFTALNFLNLSIAFETLDTPFDNNRFRGARNISIINE